MIDLQERFRKKYDAEWRKKEESLWEIIEKYPDVSPFIIIQNDVQRRGVFYTDAALALVDPEIHQLTKGDGEDKVGAVDIFHRGLGEKGQEILKIHLVGQQDDGYEHNGKLDEGKKRAVLGHDLKPMANGVHSHQHAHQGQHQLGRFRHHGDLDEIAEIQHVEGRQGDEEPSVGKAQYLAENGAEDFL